MPAGNFIKPQLQPQFLLGFIATLGFIKKQTFIKEQPVIGLEKKTEYVLAEIKGLAKIDPVGRWG